MRLTTATSTQNTYTFKRPVTKDGKLTGYAKIILFMDTQDKGWNRIDLINKVLGRKLVPFYDRGTMINIFATMNANKILSYNAADKSWSKGANFDNYVSKYLQGYRK